MGEPTLLPSTANCTVPVGLAPVTVAVKVTLWPSTDGFRDEASAVVVAALVAAARSRAMMRKPPVLGRVSDCTVRAGSMAIW